MKNSGNLKVELRGDCEIILTRVFDAPRQLVFDALTKPELLKRWGAGPPGWKLVVCDVDLRVGGTWRYVMRGPKDEEMGMYGYYREIIPPERIVNTESFDLPWYPGESLVTTILTEQDGRTTLTCSMVYASKSIRDAVLKTPMEDGVAATYDRLAELFASKKVRYAGATR